jgi:hypothetical protein
VTASTTSPAVAATPARLVFVCEFQRQASFVHNSPDYGQNIFVAMDSAGSHYGDLTDDNSPGDDTASDGTSGAYMPPNDANSSSGADIYLADFYQNSVVAGSDVNTEANREDNWKNWLSCATANDRPIGFGDYGLDESASAQTGTCTNNPNDASNAPNAMTADNSYLKQLAHVGPGGAAEPRPRGDAGLLVQRLRRHAGLHSVRQYLRGDQHMQGIETANGGR